MSTLVAQTISNGTISTSSANVINGAKAWVNFNGQGTVTIRGSYNVSSITDSGTGVYVVNFTNAFAAASYAAVSATSNDSTVRTDDLRTVSVRVVTNSAALDAQVVSVAVFS